MVRRPDLQSDAVFTGLRLALNASYAATLNTTDLTPMQALEYLSLALGSLYRDVADAHLAPDGCNCGWRPSELLDLIALQQALAIAGGTEDDPNPSADIAAMTPLGHG